MVELLRRYSNMPLPQKVIHLAGESETEQLVERPSRPAGRIHRVSQRLEPELIAQLVRDYQDGQLSSLALARKYHLSKGAVLDLLHQHDVPIRRTPPLTTAQIEQATRYYLAGDSLQCVGKRLQRDAETIRTALKRTGVPLRPAGRPRCPDVRASA